ncbi:peptidoglycan editing factor PgeF [Noviherbaspirillum sp.]|uniref:peptidoglycan editing factor PgeF n=1 Tax=Noviherbaspirillum sp. TaxID=1926288 RepID=UPI002B481A40|nr:peptidoglycan editing factor PgeF [Noviherbaspirillum sp.]HJV82627.1 peptidoglycan editing factor PgeF [Noviherbaspirillum sp.]
MDFITPDWINVPDNVGAISTTRTGGFSLAPYDDGTGGGGLNLGTHVGDDPDAVAKNRVLLRTLLPTEPAWLSQVHGTVVLDAADAADAPNADASIATRAGIVCVIQTADCLPVLFCDVQGRVVGAAHAGWRGLASGVLENTVSRMRDAGAGDILAWMGPAIGPRSFEVGQDVFDAFVERDASMASAFRALPDQRKYLADIYSLARTRLASAGVGQVYGGGLCTVTDARRFYSYRRDKVTGRMASLIWLK